MKAYQVIFFLLPITIIAQTDFGSYDYNEYNGGGLEYLDKMLLHEIYPTLEVVQVQNDTGGFYTAIVDEDRKNYVLRRISLGQDVYLFLLAKEGSIEWHTASDVGLVKFKLGDGSVNIIDFVEGDFCIGGKDFGGFSEEINYFNLNDSIAALSYIYGTIHSGVYEEFLLFKLIPLSLTGEIRNSSKADLSIQLYYDDSGFGRCYSPMFCGDKIYRDAHMETVISTEENGDIIVHAQGAYVSGERIEKSEEPNRFSFIINSIKVNSEGDLYSDCDRQGYIYELECIDEIHHFRFDGAKYFPDNYSY